MALKRLAAGAVIGLGLSVLCVTTSQSAVVVTDVQLAGPGSYYTVDINGEHVYDAAVVLTINGHQVFANCDDIFHNIGLGGQTSAFTVTPFLTDGTALN